MGDVPKKLGSGMGNRIKRGISELNPKVRAVLGGLISVVVLAAVILGVSALSAPKSSRIPESGLSSAQSDDSLYQQALSAMRSGDTTTAVSLLEQAIAADPGNDQAKSLLATIDGTSSADEDDSDDSEDSEESSDADASSADDSTSSGETGDDSDTSSNVDDPAFDAATKDLVALLPKSSDAFTLGAKIAVEDDATVSGSPRYADTIASKAVWTVHYRGSKEEAASFIDDVSKSLYPENQQSVTIDGASAYFGTDGTRFATVVYVRGRYVFEVTLTTIDGAPSALKSEAVEAAKAFPDTM